MSGGTPNHEPGKTDSELHLFTPPWPRNSTFHLLPFVAESPGTGNRKLEVVPGGIIASPQTSGRRLGGPAKSPAASPGLAINLRTLPKPAIVAPTREESGTSEAKSPISQSSTGDQSTFSISLSVSSTPNSTTSTASSTGSWSTASTSSSSSTEPAIEPTKRSPSLLGRSASFSVSATTKNNPLFFTAIPAAPTSVAEAAKEEAKTVAAETSVSAVTKKEKSPSKSPRTLKRTLSGSEFLKSKPVPNLQQKITEIKEYYRQLGKQTISVLIVEDVLSNQKLLERTLLMSWNTLKRDIPLPIEIAADGPLGVAAYQEKHHDIIFMDMHMPVIGDKTTPITDGKEATKAIRAFEKTAAGKNHRAFILNTTNSDDTRTACLAELQASLNKGELPLYDGVNGSNTNSTKSTNKEALVSFIHAHLAGMLERKRIAEAQANHVITINPLPEERYNPVALECLIM